MVVRPFNANGNKMFALSFDKKESFDETMKYLYRLAEVVINEKQRPEYAEMVSVLKERGNQFDSEYATFIYEQELPEFFNRIMTLAAIGGVGLNETREYIYEQEKIFAQQEKLMQLQTDYIENMQEYVQQLETECNDLNNRLNKLRLGLMPSDPLSH